MSERRGPKALELWCRRITDGYPGVNVQNMTTSWRDGLAFCAMIHHFRPDLIDFNSLNKDNVYGNNELAFRIAEQHLGIPALLDAEDMASCSVPDRLSILTYLSQFYQHFGGSSPSRLALSRSPENTSQGMTPVTESPQPKVMPRHLGIRRDPCAYCKLPVFLAEKLVINHKTYHRTCFKCERCNNQLTIGNYYETEDGDYCCETCPDEDNDDNNTQMMLPKLPTTSPPSSPINNKKFEINPMKSMTKSLSDEEKTRKLYEIDVNNTSLTRKMRLNFMSEQLETSSIVNNEQLNKTNDISIKLSPNDCVDNIKLDDTINSVKLSEISDNLSVKNLMVCKDTKETLDAGDDADYSSQCLNSVHETMNFHVKIEKNEVIDENELIKTTELIDKNQLIDKTGVFDDADGTECIEAGASEELDTAEGINEAEEPKIAEEPFADDSKDEINLLNAEGVDLSKEYPEEMNPFNSDDDEETDDVIKVKVQTSSRVSTNPFGSEDEDEGEEKEETPTPASRKRLGGDGERVKRRLEAPQINLNPFWSDEDDEESDRDAAVAAPVPKPRTIRQTPEGNSSLRSNLDRSGFYASSSSLASTSSTTTTPGGTYRKRKPAPPPPVPNERVSANLSDVKSPQSSHSSPIRTTPRPRKSKPAPPPPLPSSLLATLSLNPSPISWEDEKISKNQSNKSKQSQNTPPPLDEMEAFTYIDKSTQGKWKRKKGPAPALPIPQKRKIKVMSLKDVKLELDEIEVQQQGLEKQGVRLEQLIRDRCENVHDDDDNGDKHDCMTMDVEELVLELFSLVNEKNELFRRQAELMLLKRQQRLEEEHADIEYQIRCLMLQPEAMKTDFDKQREETLIQRLVEIVERRSEIVECLEMDRKREVEEDKSINWHMGLYAAKSKGDLTRDLEESPKSHKSKKFKIKEIIKDKHLKKIHKKDADKDVDETEVKLKRQNKKKWF